MPTYAFHHIHLTSSDPVKTAEFYERVFGGKKTVHDIGGGAKMASVDLNGTAIVVTAKEEGMDVPLDHFGIVTDNLEQAVGELKGQGLKFTQEIVQFGPRIKYCFLRTPDNVSIELLQV